MSAERPQNRNIKYTIVADKIVSSAEIWRYFGFWTASYETFVFEYDKVTNKAGKLLYETYQKSESKALRVHGHFVNNFEKELVK